jgi:pimeloyl-ACP methyl ester carboxylesterase
VPFAGNPRDGARIYYEGDEGRGSPVVLLNGLGDTVEASKAWGVSIALAPSHRMIYIDHRGHGRSDKPHEPAAYAIALRVADVIAAMDAAGVERAHFIGLSWGARLGFAMGERAPKRLLSLTLGGQIPYAMNPESPGIKAVTTAFADPDALAGFVAVLTGIGALGEAETKAVLENDGPALAAAWLQALSEGEVARNLGTWRTPCLIYAGSEDIDFYEDARRAAQEIPGARFVALAGLDHLATHSNVDEVLPHIRALIDGLGGVSPGA